MGPCTPDQMVGKDEDDDEELTIDDQAVVTKYKTAAEFANKAIADVAKECVAGKGIVELCDLGDGLVKEATAGVYNKGKIEKGSAFPCCISVNNCVAHHSPLASECADVLKEGDAVKIDLGIHIDGFIAVVATTIVVGQPIVEGRQADVIMATNTAADAVVKMLKPGTKNEEVTRVIQKIADIYGCNPIECAVAPDEAICDRWRQGHSQQAQSGAQGRDLCLRGERGVRNRYRDEHWAWQGQGGRCSYHCFQACSRPELLAQDEGIALHFQRNQLKAPD